MGDNFNSRPMIITDRHGNPIPDVGNVELRTKPKHLSLYRFLKQLLCRHEYVYANEVLDCFDASGHRVGIWRVCCPKCGKWGYTRDY